jgi:hypothetical protein
MIKKLFKNQGYRLGGSLLLVAVLLCSMSFTCLTYSVNPQNLFYDLLESALFQALSTAVLFTGVYFSGLAVAGRMVKRRRHQIKNIALIIACGLSIPLTAAWFGRPVDGFDFVLGLVNGVMGNLIYSALAELRGQPQAQPAPVKSSPTRTQSGYVVKVPTKYHPSHPVKGSSVTPSPEVQVDAEREYHGHRPRPVPGYDNEEMPYHDEFMNGEDLAPLEYYFDEDDEHPPLKPGGGTDVTPTGLYGDNMPDEKNPPPLMPA